MLQSSQSINNKQRVKRRKKRIIKNAYVDIDSVGCEPGGNFCNWVQITKQKLKEREHNSFQVVLAEIETILERTDKMKGQNVIPKDIIDNTLKELYGKIDAWKGVYTSRIKAPIVRFRGYFLIAKNWYNQVKKKIYGDLFWVHIFNHIHKTIMNKEAELVVVRALFHSKIHYSNTKSMLMINGGPLILSKGSHQYLLELDPSLDIKKWIKEQEMCGNWGKKAEAISLQIQSQLEIILERYTVCAIPASGIPPISDFDFSNNSNNSNNNNSNNDGNFQMQAPIMNQSHNMNAFNNNNNMNNVQMTPMFVNMQQITQNPLHNNCNNMQMIQIPFNNGNNNNSMHQMTQNAFYNNINMMPIIQTPLNIGNNNNNNNNVNMPYVLIHGPSFTASDSDSRFSPISYRLFLC